MSGGYSGSTGGENTHGGKTNGSMNRQKQNKHVPGAKEYQKGKSTIDIPIEELDALVKSNIKNAVDLGNGKMYLVLPKDVGTWKNKEGTQSEKTNCVTIHNSKTGYHCVPQRRKGRK